VERDQEKRTIYNNMVESLISQDEGSEMFRQDRITRVGLRATFISKRT